MDAMSYFVAAIVSFILCRIVFEEQDAELAFFAALFCPIALPVLVVIIVFSIANWFAVFVKKCFGMV